MKTMDQIIREHPFFKDFAEPDLLFISSCGQNKVFKKDEIVAKEGASADEFYLIREGKIAVCANLPNRRYKIIQTLNPGEIFGWSWLFPPYQWMFEGRAMEQVHVVALNGKCLRKKLEQQPALGYQVMKRFSQLMIARLNATRLQLLDLYGNSH